jgi:hypothetical protein
MLFLLFLFLHSSTSASAGSGITLEYKMKIQLFYMYTTAMKDFFFPAIGLYQYFWPKLAVAAAPAHQQVDINNDHRQHSHQLQVSNVNPFLQWELRAVNFTMLNAFPVCD